MAEALAPALALVPAQDPAGIQAPCGGSLNLGLPSAFASAKIPDSRVFQTIVPAPAGVLDNRSNQYLSLAFNPTSSLPLIPTTAGSSEDLSNVDPNAVLTNAGAQRLFQANSNYLAMIMLGHRDYVDTQITEVKQTADTDRVRITQLEEAIAAINSRQLGSTAVEVSVASNNNREGNSQPGTSGTSYVDPDDAVARSEVDGVLNRVVFTSQPMTYNFPNHTGIHAAVVKVEPKSRVLCRFRTAKGDKFQCAFCNSVSARKNFFQIHPFSAKCSNVILKSLRITNDEMAKFWIKDYIIPPYLKEGVIPAEKKEKKKKEKSGPPPKRSKRQ